MWRNSWELIVTKNAPPYSLYVKTQFPWVRGQQLNATARISPNSTWLVTSRHDTFDVSSASSRAVRQARHSQNAWARHVERVVSWRAKCNLCYWSKTKRDQQQQHRTRQLRWCHHATMSSLGCAWPSVTVWSSDSTLDLRSVCSDSFTCVRQFNVTHTQRRFLTISVTFFVFNLDF